MKSFSRKICFLFFFFFPFLLFGQDTALWIKKIESHFKSLRTADRKLLAETYGLTMASSFLSEDEKIIVDSVFQELLVLPVTEFPELKGYITCINYFYRHQEKENLKVWLTGIQKCLATPAHRRAVVKNYLETTVDLVCKQMIFNGINHQWQVRGKMEWKIEEDTIRIFFRESDLICKTRQDSILVYRTKGMYILGNDYLVAQGGKVKWNDPKDEMVAELDQYRLKLKVAGYTADSVLFYYKSKYKNPLLGQLKDYALKYTRRQNASYPEFTSYSTSIVLPNLYKNIHFCGGITYQGLKFFGSGTEKQPANLQIISHDTIRMNLYSRQFLFDSLKVMAGQAALDIVVDSGGITHPDIHFMYSVPRHTVSIKRISEQSLRSPFKDSYHRILFDTEEIFWPLDSSKMEMRMSSNSGLEKVTIESMNFFSDQVYDRMQGLDEINPLNGLLKCSMALRSTVFGIEEYAEYLKKPVDQLRKQIVLLSYGDFVGYNKTKDEVTLKQRLFDYTKARVGKQDYDNIRFVSQSGKTQANAILDIRNYNLTIKGVDKFVLSEAKHIFVEPVRHEFVMLKNRDMEFSGKLSVGMFDIYGKNLFFSYDKYAVVLPKVDSISMYKVSHDKYTREKKVKSIIQEITGKIVIDQSDNKSGRRKNSGFPVLHSMKESYVYFDNPEIQKGQYKRDSFYFKINPYTIEGLNDASHIRYAFGGTLVSSILAPIDDTLRLLKGDVLGLVCETSAKEGLCLYDKGRFYGQIILNQQGLRARGKIELNESEFRADTILLLPRQMIAYTPEIKICALKEQRPKALGKGVQINYLPQKRELRVTSDKTLFDLYNGRVKHGGTLYVYENRLEASGKLELEGATMQSCLFNLQATQIVSNNTTLNIISGMNKETRLNTRNVSADIDLIAGLGKVVNSVDTNQLEFTSSRYGCSFKNFTWYMKDTCIHIGVEDSIQLAQIGNIERINEIPDVGKNVFVSTNEALDSLRFVVPFANYNLRSGNMMCHGVNHIDIANGRFYPDKGNLFIYSSGDIQEFVNGKLLCDRTDTNHVLVHTNLKLKGRNEFNGSGDYIYKKEKNKKDTIHFTEIGTDSLRLIFAKAQFEESQPLLLNEGFHFKGEIRLDSRKSDLYFTGYIGLTADKLYLNHSWLAIREYLSAQHIRIPLKVENRNDRQQRIYNGIYLNTDKDFKPYAAFLSDRLFYHDDLLMGGEGILEWCRDKKQYIIFDTLRDKYYRFGYDPNSSKVFANGSIQLNLKIAGIYQKMAGEICYDGREETLGIGNALCILDYTLLNKMEESLLKDLAGQKSEPFEIESGTRTRINEIYGASSSFPIEYSSEKTTTEWPDSLHRLFVFDSVSFRWDDQMHSYWSEGRVNVLAIKGKPVRKSMYVKMELSRRHSGNQYFMYINDDKVWYYFEYSNQGLYTLSSNERYNNIVKTEKAENKIVRNKNKERLYTIILCPESKKERFLKKKW